MVTTEPYDMLSFQKHQGAKVLSTTYYYPLSLAKPQGRVVVITLEARRFGSELLISSFYRVFKIQDVATQKLYTKLHFPPTI